MSLAQVGIVSDYDLLSLDAVSGKMQVSMHAHAYQCASPRQAPVCQEGPVLSLSLILMVAFTGDWVLSKARDRLGCLPPDTEAGAQECRQIVSKLACLSCLCHDNRCPHNPEVQAHGRQ